MNSANPSFIKLFGQPEENLYQLGVKDREHWASFTRSLVSQNIPFQTVFELASTAKSQKIISHLMKQKDSYSKLVDAYAEGLEISSKELWNILLITELERSKASWASKQRSRLFGCSSYFRLDKEGNPLHLRVFDSSYVRVEKSFRHMQWESQSQNNFYSFSYPGIPLFFHSGINQYGLSLAIHQLPSEQLEQKGLTIFQLFYEIMIQAQSLKDVEKIARLYPTLGAWGLYLLDTEGEVLALNSIGKKLSKRRFNLHQDRDVYFGNLPIQESERNLVMESAQEHWLENMKISTVKEQAKKLKKPSEQKLFELIEQPINPNKELKVGMVNPGTKLSLMFSPRQDEVSIKFFGEETITKIKKLWIRPVPSEFKTRKKVDRDFSIGLQHLSSAQLAWSNSDEVEAFDHIQYAIEYLKNIPAYHSLSKFYFYIFRYLKCDNSREYEIILRHLKNDEYMLPNYLHDHRNLFIHRLEKISRGTTTRTEDHFIYSENKKYFNFEKDLPAIAIKSMRKLIQPQIDTFNIEYLF